MVEGKASSPSHARVLKHGISKKIEQFLNSDLPALKNSWAAPLLSEMVVRVIRGCDGVRESANDVGEIANALGNSVTVGENENSPKTPYFLKNRCGRRDSNPRYRLGGPES